MLRGDRMLVGSCGSSPPRVVPSEDAEIRDSRPRDSSVTGETSTLMCLLGAGILSFTVRGVHPHDIAQVAADSNVAIRAGHHCCQPLMKTLGVTGTARASFGLYNTTDDVDALIQAVEESIKVYR